MLKSYNITNLEEFLIEYGLTSKQAKIYLASLRLGPSPAQAIATEAKTERTNAYDALESLLARGLMSISTQGKKRLFVAEQPETLETILKKSRPLSLKLSPKFDLWPPQLNTSLAFVSIRATVTTSKLSGKSAH